MTETARAEALQAALKKLPDRQREAVVLRPLPGANYVAIADEYYRRVEQIQQEMPDDIQRQIGLHFGCRGFLIGLSSIFWRESWKYGERAFRYCNHDVGHALAALGFSANLLGWRLTALTGLGPVA